MKAFKKHTILGFIFLTIFHFSNAQGFSITGPTCVLPNTPYVYSIWGTYPANITYSAYAVGGSIIGYSPNTVTVIWQGYGDYGPAYLMLNGSQYNISAAVSWANTINLTGFTTVDNKIASVSVGYSAELGTNCGWTFLWEDAGPINFFNNSFGYTKDLNLTDLTSLNIHTLTLRRDVMAPNDNTKVWYSNVIGIQSLGITAGQDAGTLQPSPMSLVAGAGYNWYQSTDGSNWTNLPNAHSQTYNPGILNATMFYKVEIPYVVNSASATNVTIFKVNVDQPFNGGVIVEPAPVTAGQLPGTILSQQPASGGGCSSPAYQWEQSIDGVNFSPIANATAAIYSPDYVYASNWFRRKATCQGNSLYSNVVVCKAIAPLAGGTINPVSAYIPSDGNINFSSVIAATGGDAVDPIVYQWQQSDDGVNFTDIPGATGADYVPFGIDKTTYYRRKVTCGAETAYSNTSQAIKKAGNDYNYVQELVAVKPNMPDDLENYASDLQQVQQTTTYFDGLGRTFQTVGRNQSLVSGSTPTDLVKFNQYDAMGREVNEYMPFASPSTNGLLKLPAMAQQKAFYNTQLAAEPDEVNIGASADNWAYNKTIYESSPLARVTETFAQGVNWVGTNAQPQEDNRKSVKTKFWTNQLTDAVRIWNVTNITGDWGTYASAATYEPGTLTKTSTVDEQGAQTITFKDAEGKLILQKKQNTAVKDDGSGSDYTGWLCTYYIYDELQQVRAVVQPNAVKTMADASNWTLDQTMLDELCYRYEYDDHQRTIRRKAPGAEEEYMVYDALDRIVLSQHANQRSLHQWVYNKYDAQDRIVITGFYTDNTHIAQSDMQAYVDAQNYALYEEPSAAIPYYTNSRAFPVFSNDPILTVNYYDNYNFTTAFATEFRAKDNSFDNYFSGNYTTYPYPLPLTQSIATNGMQTGHWDLKTGLLQVNFYNDEGQVIQTRSMNNLGGTDIKTVQYAYGGMPLMTHYQSEKKGTNPQTVTTLSQYSCDDLGRLTTVAKKTGSSLVNNGALPADYLVISEIKYDALGQISSKKIGQQKDDLGNLLGKEMEAQIFDYNIRGWLLGINRNYLAGNTGDHFGFELAYDKQGSKMNNNSGSLYAGKMLNGNVNGIMWRSTGDGEIRKYDYSYDVAGRLTGADFNQYTSNSFNKNAKVDFTVSNLQYDNNGNIQSMKQMGLKGPESGVVDDLAYTYFTGSNRLKNVRDASNDPTSTMGDFKTSLAHPQKSAKDAASTQALRDQITDYSYDNNGNLIKDYNKDIGDAATQGITYNYLNLPELITFKKAGASNASTIAFTYDASGEKLKKVVTDNTTSTPVITTTLYNDGMVYVNDVLQFIANEEGRVRFTPAIGTAVAKLNYDYFLKDHLGNVRMILTDEHEQCTYPAATLEGNSTTASIPNALFKEKDFYDINESNIVDLPDNSISYPNNNGINNNNLYSDQGATSQKMYQLQASGGVAATGLGIVLKVMSGDKIDIFGKSYYNVDNSTHQNYSLPVESLLTGFLGGPAGLGAAKGVTGSSLGNMPAIAGDVYGFLNDPARGNDPTDTKPKAYINYILLDNQFHYAGGGFSRVGDIGQVKDHFTVDAQVLHDITVNKNGYLYVYCSNESPVKVYFDNLQVVHTKGALLEETHYYPFGLTMPGISDRAAKTDYVENNYKYNYGSELQHHELTDGSGLELYATDFRSYDPQIGRFHQADPFGDINESGSPYNYCNNSPLNYNDPLGLDTVKAQGQIPVGTARGAVVSMTNSGGGTSSYVYDPLDPRADKNGLVENGMRDAPEEEVVVTGKKKSKSKDAATPAAAPAPAAGTGQPAAATPATAPAPAVVTPAPATSTAKEGYSIQKALAKIQAIKFSGSQGKCATNVRIALEAGGINTSGHPVGAKDYGPLLIKRGFHLVDDKNYKPVVGDIAVFQAFQGTKKYHEYGHIQMFNGAHWFSDFQQNNFWAGQDYRTFKPSYKLYRW